MLIAYLYKHGYGRDVSNGGISSQFDTVVIVNADGPFEPSEKHAAVKLVRGYSPGDVIAVPVVETPDGGWEPERIQPMFGGAYVASSDTRFRLAVEKLAGKTFYGAVPLHDRYE